MKECGTPKKGIECDHMVDTESAVVYCELSHCSFKKIDLSKMLSERSEIDVNKCRG